MLSQTPPNGLRAASLFCGGGGLDLGFIQAGFQIVWAADSSDCAVSAYRENVAQCVAKLDLSLLGDWSGGVNGVDVLLAGPPCQGFSTAGRRQASDERNGLLVMAARVAAVARPK